MIIKIPNISFVDYANLVDKSDYDYYLKYSTNLKANDLFKLGDFMELPFGFVKDIQEHLNYTGLDWKTYFEEIEKKTGTNLRIIAQMSIFELYQSRLYLRDQINNINEIESSSLGHAATIEEDQAGIEVFNKYRSFLQFDNLTHGDITKIDLIRNIPYSVCFAKLKLDADKSEFESKLYKLRSKKK